MKILIFGTKGYLGSSFLELYGDQAVGSTADIADVQAVQQALDEHQPDAIINCVGKTGRPNIDWCEDHKEETLRSNVTGPLILLDECQKRDIYFVHVGSGCIYEGDNGGNGFAEDDPANYYGSFYSKTKIWADLALQEFPVLILRLRMPFDGTDRERNLIVKISKYSKILDDQNSITYLPDFLDVSKQLIEKKKTGIYHIVNPGITSPLKIMQRYKELVDPSHEFTPFSTEDMLKITKTGRSNCLLNTEKLTAEGITLRHVDEVVDEALKQIAESRGVVV